MTLRSMYVGTKEAADILGVNQSTISNWCRHGRISGAEQDAKWSPWRIPTATINRLLEQENKIRNGKFRE